MKFKLDNLFTNQYILYIILFFTLTNIFGYLMQEEYAALLLFCIIVSLASYFSENMTVVLTIALFSTNFLYSLMNIYSAPILKESFESNSKNKKCSKQNSQSDCTNVEGCDWFNNKCINKSANSDLKGEDIINESILVGDFNLAKQKEAKHDQIEEILGSDSIRTINNKTDALLQEQNSLIKQMSDLGPVLKEAMSAIKVISTGPMQQDYTSMFDSLQSKLDNLYTQYPDSFPANYTEESKNLKNAMQELKKYQNTLSKSQPPEVS